MKDFSPGFQGVVIGASTGGLNALQTLLGALPAGFAGVVMIVQHRRSAPDDLLSNLLRQHCRLPIRNVSDKTEVHAGHVYIAPPNYHLLVEQDGSLSLSIDAPISYARPSIDVLFETAAEVYGKFLVGILLTGANHDGTAGLAKIKAFGGITIAQDPASAEASFMPQSAIDAGVVDHVLPLSQIADFVVKIFQQEVP